MIESQEKGFNIILEFLSRLDISEKDVADFREVRVLPGRRDLFDVIDEDKQKKMIAIDRLPLPQLNELIRLAKIRDSKLKHTIHDVRGILLDLNNCTEDEKYDY